MNNRVIFPLSFLIFLLSIIFVPSNGDSSAVQVIEDIYKNCITEFDISCARSKAVNWLHENTGNSVIRVTDDLLIKTKIDPSENEINNRNDDDILEKFETFLQSHEVVAKLPSVLHPNGPFKEYIPRSFQATDISVPLAATGRSSKLIKRVIFPFLLGLKFKTAILVPLALALIALKTWKALTLGLLSLVISGAIAIFSKLLAPKVPAYEVLHYHPHVDHVPYPHHVDVLPAPLPLAHPVYVGRTFNGQDLAYEAYRK